MATQAKFRHQDIAVPPAGTKVRTIHAGSHELRIAFPKGARKKGSGTLVSILHPLQEKNPSCGGVLQLGAAELSSIAIPIEAADNGFGQGFEDALQTAAAQNPTDWRALWESFKGKISSLLHHGDTEAQSNPPRLSSKQKKALDSILRKVSSRRAFDKSAAWDAYRAYAKKHLSGDSELHASFYFGEKLRELELSKFYQNPAKAKKNYTEQVKDSKGRTWFVDVLQSGGRWMAEGYPVKDGKVRKVGKPKVAYGDSESAAYDALTDSMERNPKNRAAEGWKKVRGVKVAMKDFAYVGDPSLNKTWHLPVDTKAHAKDALSRFKHTRLPKDARHAVAERIVAANKKFGTGTEGFEASYLKNPAKQNLDHIDAAVEVAEEFKGSPVTEVREIEEPSKHRDDFGHLGWVEQLVFQPSYDRKRADLPALSKDYFERMERDEDPVEAWKKIAHEHGIVLLVLDVKGDEIELTATGFKKQKSGKTVATQLALVGGRQDQFAGLLEYWKTDTEHDSADLGDLVSITYEAEKAQLGDTEPRPYYHIFGEEDGTAPRASFDMLNKRIRLAGGSYHLKEAGAGIVN